MREITALILEGSWTKNIEKSVKELMDENMKETRKKSWSDVVWHPGENHEKIRESKATAW